MPLRVAEAPVASLVVTLGAQGLDKCHESGEMRWGDLNARRQTGTGCQEGSMVGRS